MVMRKSLFVSGLMLVAVSASTILSNASTSSVDVVIDRNWRGAYDILVTPPDADFGGAVTSGLVDANFVATSQGQRIGLDQLAAVREIDGVELAAPIGMVGVLRNISNTPLLRFVDDPVSVDTDVPAGGTILSLTSSVMLRTPEGAQELSRASGVVYLSRRDTAAVEDPIAAAEAGPSALGTPAGFLPLWDDTGYTVPLGGVPAFGSGVVAVDPVAERELLGGAAFLEPLAGLSDEREAASSAVQGEVVPQIDRDRFLVQAAMIEQAAADATTAATPVVPMLVNEDRGQSSLTIEVRVDEHATSDSEVTDGTLAGLAASLPVVRTANVSIPADGALVPFSTARLVGTLPGRSVPSDVLFGYLPASDLQAALIGRPQYTSSSTAVGGRPTFVVSPLGLVGADGLSTPAAGVGFDPTVGLTQSYRSFSPLATGGVGLPAPIGTFTMADLHIDSTAVSYVPLGAYDPARTTLERTPDGGSAETPVTPSLSGLDFITGSPGAITDLAGGRVLTGTSPIDAIRVRVAGITGYDDSGTERVARVAADIARLGLTATVVAGSSQQPVSIYVPDRVVDAEGVTTDLGWVRQDWTTLGAAASVVSAMTRARWVLVVLALATAAGGAVLSAISAGRSSRQFVATTRQIGWTDLTIRRRLLAADAAVIVPAAAACLTVAAWPGADPLQRVAGAVGLGALTGAAVTRVLVATSAPWVRTRRASTLLGGPRDLAWQRLRRSGADGLAQVAGYTLIGASATAAFATLAATRDRVGATRLALTVWDAAAVASVSLGVVGVVVGILMVVDSRRTIAAARAREHALLATIGVREGVLAHADGLETAVTGLAGGCLCVVGGLVATLLGGSPLWASMAGVAAAGIAVLAVFAGARRRVR